MLISMHKVIGIKCQTCNSNMYTDLNPFKLNNKFVVACDVCEEEFVTIYKNKQNNYTILIKCFICEEIHRYEISYSSFWKDEVFALGCHASGIDICFIGEMDQVNSAMGKLDDHLESMIEDVDDIAYSNMNERTELALNVIESMVKEHNILCLCGNLELEATLKKDGILISCGGCGASEFLKTESQEDIDKLIKRKTIVLV